MDESISRLISELDQLVAELTGNRFTRALKTVASSDFSLSQEPVVGETLLGNFVTDAMRMVAAAKTGQRVDFSLQANGQFLHCSIHPGDSGSITFFDLSKVVAQGSTSNGFPGYPLASVYLTGREVWTILNAAVMLPKMLGATFYLQFSGFRTHLDPGQGNLVKVERYTGEGPQGADDYEYVLLEPGDESLYHMTTDYHVLSFSQAMLETMQLDVVFKDAAGNPLKNIESAVIHDHGREVTVWQAVVEYAASQPAGPAGIPRIPTYYSAPSHRVNQTDAPE